MGPKRFLLIEKYICFADNQKLTQGNKVVKVLPLYNLFNFSIVKFGIFHEDLSIDEFTAPYFGKHLTKLFISGSQFVSITISRHSMEATVTPTICKFIKVKKLENPHDICLCQVVYLKKIISIKIMYDGSESCVRVGQVYTDWLTVATGVRQGDARFPLHFKILLDLCIIL